jgi:hypothetical protein
LGATAAAVGSDAVDRIDGVRTVLEKWVETRRQVSEERLDWARKRETLQDRMDVVNREIKAVNERMDETRRSLDEAVSKGEGLRNEAAQQETASSDMIDLIASLEQRTQELLVQVPQPIRERLKPFSQRIPTDKRAKQSSLSERFQNVVAILNDLSKAAGEIITTSEVRAMPDGRSAEVTALYVGISKGYSIDGTGTLAAVGWGTPEGWVWTPANDSAAEIASAIAILTEGLEPRFVRMPAEVK